MADETHFLVVEDDPNDVFMLELALEQSAPDARVHVVGDGEAAMEYLLRLENDPHRNPHTLPYLILLDLKMPKMGGFEFLDWLRNHSPGNLRLLPVVVMSSSNLSEDVLQAYDLGGNSYMVKTINWEQFKQNMATLHLYWSKIVEKAPIE